jgi:lambda repressor-like predicted transcriptional regulator
LSNEITQERSGKMIDRQEIKACMARKGLNLDSLSKEMGISMQSLHLKITKKRLFNENEISTLLKILGRDILILD